MKIQGKYIGQKSWSPVLRRWMVIEEGKEDFYVSIGISDIYEKEEKPKLVKNAKNRKRRDKQSDSDSQGIDHSPESEVSI
jgi:hypothetical protein